MPHPVELHHKVIGEGNPIVLLHGLFGMSDNLQILGKVLVEHGNMVYLVDQRDHGRSPFTNEFSYPVLANDLLHFLESQWLHQTQLIGHSMGGKTALQFVVDHPGIVTKLVIIDMGIKKYSGGHEAIFEALLSVPVEKIKKRDEVFQMLIDKIADEGTVLFLMKNLSRNKETHIFEWKINLQLLKNNYDNILAGIHLEGPQEVEVLFIRGEKSTYITDKDIPQIKKYFPNAVFKTIPKAGHWVHVDNPEVLFQEIISFIET